MGENESQCSCLESVLSVTSAKVVGSEYPKARKQQKIASFKRKKKRKVSLELYLEILNSKSNQMKQKNRTFDLKETISILSLKLKIILIQSSETKYSTSGN